MFDIRILSCFDPLHVQTAHYELSNQNKSVTFSKNPFFVNA